jgi:hypothetical protein
MPKFFWAYAEGRHVAMCQSVQGKIAKRLAIKPLPVPAIAIGFLENAASS